MLRKKTEMLTPREVEVVRLLAEGCSLGDVARRLSISPRTAETHRQHAAHKLGIHNLALLTRWAIREGLVHL